MEIDRTINLEGGIGPSNFLHSFYQSEIYRSAYANFFQDKTISDDVTEQEMRTAFYESVHIQHALIDFHQDFQDTLSPEMFPELSKNAIEDYIITVRQQLINSDESLIEEIDKIRSIKHNKVAMALIEDDVVPSHKLGKTVARLVLVELNLDSHASAYLMDKKIAK